MIKTDEQILNLRTLPISHKIKHNAIDLSQHGLFSLRTNLFAAYHNLTDQKSNHQVPTTLLIERKKKTKKNDKIKQKRRNQRELDVREIAFGQICTYVTNKLSTALEQLSARTDANNFHSLRRGLNYLNLREFPRCITRATGIIARRGLFRGRDNVLAEETLSLFLSWGTPQKRQNVHDYEETMEVSDWKVIVSAGSRRMESSRNAKWTLNDVIILTAISYARVRSIK